MNLPPFDMIETRRELLSELNSTPGLEVVERLTGRPHFPMAAIGSSDRLEQFLSWLDRIVDAVATQHFDGNAANAPAMPLE